MARALPFLSLLLLGALLGCGHGSLPPVAAEQPPLPEGLAPLRDLSHGGCPDLSTPGPKAFRSGGLDRQATFLFPEGAPEQGRAATYPLLVVFHGLGASAKSMIPRMQLEELAAGGAVVVVPEGHPSARLTWGAGPAGMADAVLLEDIRHCAWRELGADPARLHAAGFSAGGLWSTLLLMHASEVLAGVTIFSGGELKPWVLYKRPKARVPTLVLWGGEGDVYRSRGFNVAFDAGSRSLSEHLARDGHLVARCDHGQGHRLPTEYAPLLHAWTRTHRWSEPGPMPPLLPGCEALAPPADPP